MKSRDDAVHERRPEKRARSWAFEPWVCAFCGEVALMRDVCRHQHGRGQDWLISRAREFWPDDLFPASVCTVCRSPYASRWAESHWLGDCFEAQGRPMPPLDPELASVLDEIDSLGTTPERLARMADAVSLAMGRAAKRVRPVEGYVVGGHYMRDGETR